MRTLLLASTVACTAIAAPALAQDHDADGVPDSADLFPCDATAAAIAFAPAEGAFSTVFYEDNWPAAGDLDFNDGVLGYNVAAWLGADGRVARLRLTVRIEAAGGEFHSGLAWALPILRTAPFTASRTLGGTTQAILPWTGETDIVLPVLANLRDALAGASGPTNVDAARPVVPAGEVTVDVVFQTPVVLDTSAAPYDLFFHRSNDTTHQVHFPGYRGTSTMNGALFGTADDGSTVQRSFVDRAGLPFVFEVPTESAWTTETTPIDQLFPRITAWAAAGGGDNPFDDFYVAPHVVDAVSFQTAKGVSLFTGGPSLTITADTSCRATSGNTRQTAGRDCAGILLARPGSSDGIYWIDPDGDLDTSDAFQTFCDMTTDGGGWTLAAYAGDNTAGFPRMDVDVGSFTPAVRAGKASRGAVQLARNSHEIALAYHTSTNHSGSLAETTDTVAFFIPDPGQVDLVPGSTGVCTPVTARRLRPDGSNHACVGDNRISTTAMAPWDCRPTAPLHFQPGVWSRSLGGTYNTFAYGIFDVNYSCNSWYNVSHHWWVDTQYYNWEPSATQHWSGAINGATSIWFRRNPTSHPSRNQRYEARANCSDILAANPNAADGLYWIDPDGDGDTSDAFQTFCDMTTDGGGWTLAAYAGDRASGFPRLDQNVGTFDATRRTQNASRDAVLLARQSTEVALAYHPSTNFDGGLAETTDTVAFEIPDPSVVDFAPTPDNGACVPVKAWRLRPAGSTEACIGDQNVSRQGLGADDCNPTRTAARGAGLFTRSLGGTYSGSFAYGLFDTFHGCNSWNNVSHHFWIGNPGYNWQPSRTVAWSRNTEGSTSLWFRTRTTTKPATIYATCKAILQAGQSTGDGVYWIDPTGGSPQDAYQTYCDMTLDGGGWTLAAYAGDKSYGFPAMHVDVGSFRPLDRRAKGSRGAVAVARQSTEMALAYANTTGHSGSLASTNDAVAFEIPDPTVVDLLPNPNSGTCTPVNARRLRPAGSNAACIGSSGVSSTAQSATNCNPTAGGHRAGVWSRSLGGTYNTFAYGLFDVTYSCNSWPNISHHWWIDTTSYNWQPSATSYWPNAAEGAASIWFR